MASVLKSSKSPLKTSTPAGSSTWSSRSHEKKRGERTPSLGVYSVRKLSTSACAAGPVSCGAGVEESARREGEEGEMRRRGGSQGQLQGVGWSQQGRVRRRGETSAPLTMPEGAMAGRGEEEERGRGGRRGGRGPDVRTAGHSAGRSPTGARPQRVAAEAARAPRESPAAGRREEKSERREPTCAQTADGRLTSSRRLALAAARRATCRLLLPASPSSPPCGAPCAAAGPRAERAPLPPSGRRARPALGPPSLGARARAQTA